MEEKQLLSLNEAASRLGVSWQTCRNWAEEGRIAYVRMGRLRKIPIEEVNRLVREGTHPQGLETSQEGTMEEKQLLSLNEAASRLGVSWQSTRHWAAEGLIASVRMGRLRKIPIEEVNRLVREGTHPAHEAR